MSVLESSKWLQDPVTIFYEEEHDILLWSEFLSRRKSSGILLPSFLKLPRTVEEMMRVLVNLKHQGSSSSSPFNNIILFVANVALASQFLSSCQTSGVLSDRTNLLITTLVSPLKIKTTFPFCTVFENHRKSLIQHCERSELRKLAVKQCYQTGQF